METNQYFLERDSNGLIDTKKFKFDEEVTSVDKAIKVLDANFTEPLFSHLNIDLN